jgi:membrane protein DedA with SNARE-associated domain
MRSRKAAPKRNTMNNLWPELPWVVDVLVSHGGLWVYLLVVAAMTIEYVFPPFPGDVAIFAAGFISGEEGISVIIVILASLIGSFIGITAVYWVGNRYGRKIIESRKIWFLNNNLLRRTEAWYHKVGEKLLIISKYLPGVRFALVIFAGIANVDFKKALTFTLISCLIWNSMVILLAYYLRENLAHVYKVITTYSNVVFFIILAIVIIWLVRFLWKRRQTV